MNTVIHCSIDKKAVDAYYTGLTEEIQTNPKVCEFKIDKRIFFIDSILKASFWMYKIRDSNRETITGRFYEK